MKPLIHLACSVALLGISGCAHIDFGGDGLTYFDPTPFLFVSVSAECVATATVVVIPGEKKTLKFVSGYGSSELSASLANGMLSSVGQKSDSKVPETITSVASLLTAAAASKALSEKAKAPACSPTAILYPIVSGMPDVNRPLPLLGSK